MIKRITSFFSILMLFMLTIGQSLVPIIASAKELNTIGLVDSFKLDKSDLQSGELTKITVNFSEKNGIKLQPGDTLTLALPPELNGLNTTFDLSDYGTCKVTSGTVVCTFNDKADTHQNIRGYLNFRVQATNAGTGEKKEFETNLGTNLDKQTVTITGPSGGGGTNPGKQPFFYKTGDMLSGKDNEVRWFLNINLNKEELSSNIVVSDSLREGQILNKDSFRISVDNYLGRQSLSLQDFESKGYGKITFTSDTSFKVVLYKDKARLAAFSIAYTSTITEAGKKQEFFKNDYTVDYQVLYKEPVSESGSYQVENMAAGGGAEGELPSKGTLRIVKHLEGNEEKVIPKVSFKLYKESGEQVGNEHETNEKGIIEILNLQPGKYYVQEVSAPDYVDFDPQEKISFEVKSGSVNGIKLPIPNKVKTTFIAGTKTWNDNDASDRPTTIKVDLLQDGQVIKTQEVSEATGWKYTFKDLAAYNANGVAYKYEVKEQPVDGYKSEVKGYDITNTKVAQTKVEGTKTWKDGNATDRPSMIKVDLLRDGQVMTTQEVSEATGWKYTFKDLAAYDANGVAYKYEVKEQPVDGYKSEVKGYDITNTKVAQTKVEGTKTWKDGNATDRPSMIKVDLLRDGQVIKTQEVSEATGWKYTFKDLAAYDANGVAYKYEVKEQPVDGYKSEVKGYDITNTKDAKTTVAGTKTWNDNNASDRPTTIKVDLLQNGNVIQTQDVTALNGWNYLFTDLARYDANGVPYTYTVKEHPVAGYKSEVNGYNITNTKVAKLTVEGIKTWKDGNGIDRPSMIKVNLLQNGNVFKTQDVLAVMGWKYIFADLEAYDANGVAYQYEVKEQPIAGYKSSVSGYDITNTKVGETKVEGTKTWKDDNAPNRPSMIKVDLLQNGKVITTQEVSEASDWKYAFKDLAAYDANGVAYKYEVKEQPVDGYKSEVKGYDITNTKVAQTEVEGTKTWKDGNATDRPKTIKVDLLQNGQVMTTQEVSEATGWKYTFKDLAAYDAEGTAYKYEVKEQPVDGYKSEVKGYDITNTKVGQTKVEGTKTWKDDNATDRPKTIKVDLLQNGQVIATQEVSGASGWKYEFKDLAAYDVEGKAYKYEVKEQPVDGYKSEVKGYDITNTKIIDVTVVDPIENAPPKVDKEVPPTTENAPPKVDKEVPPTIENAPPKVDKEVPSTTENAPSKVDSEVPPTKENTSSKINTEVSPTKENNKMSAWLPKTGGTSMEMISIIAGMVMLILGGVLFARQRMR